MELIVNRDIAKRLLIKRHESEPRMNVFRVVIIGMIMISGLFTGGDYWYDNDFRAIYRAIYSGDCWIMMISGLFTGLFTVVIVG